MQSAASSPERNTSGSKTKGILKFIVKFAVSGALMAWIIMRQKDDIVKAVSDMKLWIPCTVFAMIAVQVFLTGIRWREIMKMRGMRLSIFEVTALTFQGCFATIFIPGGAVGGDVVKAVLVSRRVGEEKRLDAVVSIFVDRIAGMAALFGFTLIMLFVYLPDFMRLNTTLRMTCFAVAAMSAAGLSAALVAFLQEYIFRWKPAAWCLDLANRLLKGFPGRVLDSVSMYRREWKKMLLLTALTICVFNVFLIVGMSLPVIDAGVNVPPPGHLAAAVTFGNTAAIVPMTQGGIGVRDAVSSSLFKAFGAPEGPAALAVVVYSAALMALYILSGIFFLLPLAASGGPACGREEREESLK